MALNRVPFNGLVDDDGSGRTGTPWNKQAIKDVILDPVDAAISGVWTDVAFNPANFWSDVTGGMVAINRYMVIGKTLWWQMQVVAATVPNPLSAYLPFTMPGGYGALSVLTPTAFASDNNGVLCEAQVVALNPTALGAFKTTGAQWLAYPCAISFTAVVALL